MLTLQYIILGDDGSTETKTTTIKIKNGKKSGSVTIEPETGIVAKIKNNISVEPETSEKYEFVVKNETDFKNNSILYGTVLYIDMERYGLDAISYSVLRSFDEVYLTGSTVEITSEMEAEVVDNYRGQPSIREQHAYDFILLVDADVEEENIVVTNINGIGEGEEVDLGETIGSIEYEDELYAAYRLSNPVGWSVVVGPDEEPIGYTWKYKIQKK